MGPPGDPVLASPLLDTRPSTLGLIVGDLLAISLVFAIGLLSHGIDPIAHPLHTARTVIPFVIGWGIAAPIVGGYRPTVRSHPRYTVAVVALSWIGAALIGSAIRSTDPFPGGSPLVFLAVTIATGILVLLPWRIVALLVLRRR